MFHKKKFTLVQEKEEKKMYTAKHFKWVNYLVILALIAFILLIILANVKSKSYYRNLNNSTKANEVDNSGAKSIVPINEMSTRATAISCQISSCVVTCTGDMTGLSKYLGNQKSCKSIKLKISEFSFPNNRLATNWLEGSFNLSYIELIDGTLNGIDSGAFSPKTVTYVDELVLNVDELQSLSEFTFVGLNSLKTLTLTNRVEIFSGNGFLTPMVKTLTKVKIKHVTGTATDPAPWLRGGNYPKLATIDLDYSNIGGYINADTFAHLKTLNLLTMRWCKITYIGDGAFDFLISQPFFIIFLENNQLKRLAGNYLTKVDNDRLRWMHLTNNLWNCNCELEDLVREFKRSPKGFGENTTCRTPSKFAGIVLSEVDLDPCEDTTTEIWSTPTTRSATTTTTADTTTLSTSTELTTIPITEEPPSSSTIEPITTTLDPSSSTTTSSEPPATYSSTESTTLAVQTPTTLNDEQITTPTTVTTPSPQNRTTTQSANIIFIECKRYTIESSESTNLPWGVELSPPDTQFSISALSQTSVQLKMEDPSEDLAVIWFYDQPNANGTRGNILVFGEFKVGCQSELEDSLVVEGLAKNRAYTFCLVKQGVQLISPFNCRSYCSSLAPVGVIDEREVWIKCEDKALTIGLFIFGILISVCIGLVGMFLLLRYQPALLKGSKRVIVVNRSTGDVLVMPRPGGKSSMTESSFRDSTDTETTIRQRRFSETSIQSGLSYMMANNYEDIEYRWKMNVANDMIYANRVPKSPPPPLPKRTSQDVALTKENVDKMKVAVVYQKGNDYGYIG